MVSSVNPTEAKARLVDLAEAGEMIEITRNGEPVARLTRIIRARKTHKALDMERIRRVSASIPFDDEPACEFVRRMRDEDRY